MRTQTGICLLLVAGASVAASDSFNYPDFSDSPASISLVADASFSGGVIRLAPAVFGQHGAAWHRDPVLLEDGFETVFTYRAAPGPDGLAFAIQRISDIADGGGGGWLGYGGLVEALAVEFDTFNNGSHFGILDPNANHVAVISHGHLRSEASHSYSLGQTTPPFNIDDGVTREIRIRYIPGSMSLFLEDSETPFLQVEVDLTNIDGDSILDDNGRAWIGFTAATGNQFSDHDLVSWTFAATQQPCSDADFSEPFGVLDLLDISAFTSGFLAMDAIADLNTDGLFDLDDITQFVTSFLSGCG